jgi:hypothetical protein
VRLLLGVPGGEGWVLVGRRVGRRHCRAGVATWG